MQIPATFFGSAPEVRGRVSRLVTRLKKGATLQALLGDDPQLSTTEYPDSLIWTNSIRPTRAADACDFRLVLLQLGLAKVDWNECDAIRTSAAPYLGRTAWGTAILTSGQGGFWYRGAGSDIPPRRAVVVALLRGLVDHWDELTAEGQRFTCGGYGKPFASPLTTDFVPLLARLGLAVGTRKTGGTGIWTSGTAFDDPRPILAREDAINRLAMDDQYWQRFVMSP